MSSRWSRSSLPSTTLPRHHRRRRGGDDDQSTTGRLSRRRSHRRSRPYGSGRRAAFMTDALSPISMSGDPERRAASMMDTPSPISMSGDLECRAASMMDTPSPISMPGDLERRAASMTEMLSPIFLSEDRERRVTSMMDTLSPISIPGDPEHRAASVMDTTSPISMDGDRHSLLSQPLHAIDVGVQPQHQELQESESELDSPPRITMLPFPKEEPDSPGYATGPTSPTSSTSSTGPTSPTGPSCAISVRVNASESPKDSPNDADDEYFNYLVDKFVSVAANVCSSTLLDDEPDYKEETEEKNVLCAKRALEHYNNDDKNKVKYELISTIVCNDMLISEGCFSHVNFTARGNQLNAKELFFAELRWENGTPVPTCVICFKGIKKIGGLRGSKYDKYYSEGLPIDMQHCYACHRRVKHPRDGELYGAGHVAMSKHYWDSDGMI